MRARIATRRPTIGLPPTIHIIGDYFVFLFTGVAQTSLQLDCSLLCAFSRDTRSEQLA